MPNEQLMINGVVLLSEELLMVCVPSHPLPILPSHTSQVVSIQTTTK